MSKKFFLKQVGKAESGYQANAGDDMAYPNPEQWELRFAIDPTPENINLAAKVAADVLLPEGIESREEPAFKIFTLNDPAQSSLKDIGIEGPYVGMGVTSDRDQRGKEFCLYLRKRAQTYAGNASDQFEKTPQEWKDLILRLWKSFSDAGVKMGYIPPQIGDKELPCEAGIVTPVSYAVTGPQRDWPVITADFWQNLAASDIPLDGAERTAGQGVIGLVETLYGKHETKLADPLAGVKITHADLGKVGIKRSDYLLMQQRRVDYLSAHVLEAMRTIGRELIEESKLLPEIKKEDEKSAAENLSADLLKGVQSSFEALSELVKQNPSPEGLQQALGESKEVANISKFFHRYESDILSLPRPIQSLFLPKGVTNRERTKFLQNFTESLQSARGFFETIRSGGNTAPYPSLEEFRKNLLEKFSKDKNIFAFLTGIGIDKGKLELMIINNPAQMQLFYRRLREIKKEKMFSWQEEERLAQLMHRKPSKEVAETKQPPTQDRKDPKGVTSTGHNSYKALGIAAAFFAAGAEFAGVEATFGAVRNSGLLKHISFQAQVAVATLGIALPVVIAAAAICWNYSKGKQAEANVGGYQVLRDDASRTKTN